MSNHLIYLWYQNIYTVILIDTTFSEQNQEKVLFISKVTTSQQNKRSCWSHSTGFCQWRVLFFFLFFEQNGVFYWSSHHQVVKGCWGKSCINSTSKDSVYLPPSDHFPSRSHYFPDQATSSLMCLCVVHLQVRPLRSSSTETLFG